MSLIKSISGIRGTIGGLAGDNLTPPDLVKLIAAYSQQLKNKFKQRKHIQVVIGRDGRISGPLIHDLLRPLLNLNGLDVLDLDLATTPTVEMMVIKNKAQGGIIISASHNPAQWNALKLLNEQGEFLSAKDGQELLKLAKQNTYKYPGIDNLGSWQNYNTALDEHIKAILDLDLVNKNLIAKRKFKIIVDGINSVGAQAVPALLKQLGVNNIKVLNSDINGRFAHNPEPLARNLGEIMSQVRITRADLGIVVDPDVDRLAFIDEQGQMFGEEYTLVAVADYVLNNYQDGLYKKATVSNLSSSRALKDISEKKGASYFSSAVGEINVVQKMKEKLAVIGGEGNGGVIYPPLHYGRDSLVGIALFLSYLALSSEKVSQLRQRFPDYIIIKDRLDLRADLDLKKLFSKLISDYQKQDIIIIDGLKINWSDSWVHLRASNTEPILRIYAEADNRSLAQKRVKEMKKKILSYIG